MTIPRPYLGRSIRIIIKKAVKVLLMLVLVSLPVIGLSRLITQKKSTGTTTPQATAETQVMGAQAVTPVNYEFTYFLNQKKKYDPESPQLRFAITEAEKRDEILVKGKKATAIEGRTFLILNVKIANPTDQGVSINTRDFFRLATNGNLNEWLAPDIHNDPVEVQAISTKYTRLGFPINDGDTNLVIQVGQIDAEKQQIPLTF